MGSLGGDEQLDEVHCLWALCPHPCCWEAERRIADGIYRRAVRAPTKHCTIVEESFPSLTVVDVCEWAGVRAVNSERTYSSRIPVQAVPPHRKHTTPSTDSSFPAIPSEAAKSHTRESGTRAKGVRDNTAHISPLIGSPWASGPLMLWVTNPRYIPQCLKSVSSKPPHCAVKELICVPASRAHSTPEANCKVTTRRVRFPQTSSPLTFHPSQRAESVHPGRLEAGTGDASAAVDEPRHPRDLRAFMVKYKPAVFHSVQDRGVRRVSQDAPASLYKLDSKTGEEDVDWDSLRGQPYLWKRRNVPPKLLSPPGGPRGAQEAVGSYPGSKVRSDRMLHSPQCAPWPCVKRTLHHGQNTHPLLSPYKHHRGTGSELDMTIRSTSAVTEHNRQHRMLDTDERHERDRDSKGAVAPLNEFYGQRSTHQLYENSNPSPDLRIASGVMEPWGRSSTEHLCTSIPSISQL